MALQALGTSLAPGVDIVSSESPDNVRGEITARVAHPFGVAHVALKEPGQWCEILILHLNVKYCRASGDGAATLLRVLIGKKHDQPMEDAYPVDFAYRVDADSGDLLRVTLGAGEGPLGTRDYRIVLEASPIPVGGTLIRLSYSYSYGTVARVAMQAYFATTARDKVGFTVIGTDGEGAPRYIGGMRGLTERNTMRYYLAIESFLDALSAPPHARLEKSLLSWFVASERYPRQLHEMQQGDYLVMKRAEHARQQPPKPQ